MASATLISVSEYLATSYRPDCDLVDGHLVERNLGEYDHASLQRALILWFGNRERAWNIRVLPEQRVQVIPSRFRVPDVCVISRERPIEQIITHPPVICIEVLSKDDTLRSLQDRIDDYLNLGVPNIWVIDPVSRRAYVCTRTGFSEPQDGILRVAGTPIEINLAELFADLD
jgi:Uma2 family endonuclease